MSTPSSACKTSAGGPSAPVERPANLLSAEEGEMSTNANIAGTKDPICGMAVDPAHAAARTTRESSRFLAAAETGSRSNSITAATFERSQM